MVKVSEGITVGTGGAIDVKAAFTWAAELTAVANLTGALNTLKRNLL